MEVLAFDAYTKVDGLKYVDLDTLFKESDIISLHCPLTEETKHIINAISIEMMKKGVVILNTSRGGLIDSKALLDGIKSRKIGAALLDVYEEEADLFYNDKSNHILDDEILRSLISMPNVIVTGHQAFLTKEALSNIATTTIDNIEKYFNGIDNPTTEVCYHCGKEATCHDRRCRKCF
jgi:D-lactate dehydrogenase